MMKLFYICIGFCLGTLFGIMVAAPCAKEKTVTKTVYRTDSITFHDTLTIIKPIVRDSVIVRHETAYLPFVYHDTIAVSDGSALVDIPISQKQYSDSTYTAWVSGYRQNLDSISVFPKTTVVDHYITTESTNTVVKRPRLSVGLTAGYGYAIKSKDLQPFVGIGLTWRLF